MGRSETPHGTARLRWLPNALTAARLAALPVLLLVLVREDGTTSVLAWTIFAVVAVTDFLDGFLARRLGAESRFGRIADPLADRLLVGVGLVGVLLLGGVSPVAPVILLVRDVAIVAGAVYLLRRGVDLRVDMAGKISSTLTMIATGTAMLFDQAWVEVVLWAAVAIAVGTFANYIRQAAAMMARSGETSTRP
ncbi:MAG: CDP-diacylglycerol--glycerol-3-phosphate 3-phosphatidyltransferase [Thermoleophilia bacterium]|nr:CDP-diacylglycerol--glycerol-3-phosphate 3-phosphatidyltransferase [Thermoleophilia bacterium]